MSLPINSSKSQVETALRELERRLRNRGVVTLRPGETSTDVTDPRIHHGLGVFLSAQSQTAAETAVWVVSVERGKFTLGHAASGAVDRSFAWMLA